MRYFLLVTVLLSASIVRAEALGSSLMEKGAFDAIQIPINQLITLKLDGSRIQLDRRLWEPDKKSADQDDEGDNANVFGGNANLRARINVNRQQQTPVEQAFNALQKASGGMATSRMISGNSRATSFTGGSVNGRMESTQNRVIFEISENAAPFRSIQVTDDPEGIFRLMLTSSSGDLILINQTPAGGASICGIVGETKLIDTAKTFGELRRKHRDIFETSINPVLERVGIGLALSPDSPEVHAKVVAMLTPVTDADRAAASALLKELDSPDFATREAAREQLLKLYDRYRAALTQLASETTLSNDAKASLDQIRDARSSSSPAERIVVENKLLDDPKYLARILTDQDAAARTIIVAHLEKISGQSFGNDVKAWEKWANEK